MIRLTLADEYKTTDDLLLALEHIVGLIGGGCTSGHYPTWSLTGEEAECVCGRPYLDDPESGDGNGHTIDCPAGDGA